jgi:hypothetical protein
MVQGQQPAAASTVWAILAKGEVVDQVKWDSTETAATCSLT